MPASARARQVPGGTSTPGANLHIKDHDRVGSGCGRTEELMPLRDLDQGNHDAPGSAVREDSDEFLQPNFQI